jgi:hypothetical protein
MLVPVDGVINVEFGALKVSDILAYEKTLLPIVWLVYVNA